MDTIGLSDAQGAVVGIRDWYYQTFNSYGLRFGLRANDTAILDAACAAAPFGWQTAPGGEVDVCYSFCVAPPGLGQPNAYLLICDGECITRTPDLESLLTAFTHHAELLTAERARDMLFVHAGVVGWHDRAIVIPGRSFSGKTTLIKALVEAGATYYSDEFAILDQEGFVYPYALPLSLRDAHGQPIGKLPVTSFGGTIGTEPLPVGLVIVSRYAAGARWRPRPLAAGQALLALMDNTVAAQGDPAHSMPILRAALAQATVLTGARGEATTAARAILRHFPA